MTRKVEDQARWLADKFASQDKKIASLQTRGELAYSSIEDGAIVEKDLEGNLVASVGKQHDGSHVAVPYTGPTPAAPVAASLKAVPGVVEVRWSGKFTGDAVSAMDFKHVSVHVSTTPAVDATPNTQVATIRGELGDVATVTAVEGMLYVVLVAWSTAGKASAPSPVAAVAVPGAVGEAWIQGKLDDIDERYDGVITEAGNLGTRLSTAEQDLTAAQGRLTDAESDLTDAFGQIGTVDGKATVAAGAASAAGTAAATAQGKADTAKTAADQAAADALAAAGLAGTKGKTLIQPTAPGAADRNNVTLWIDTTAGANTPKRWTSGTTWVAVTDKVAMDAGSTAASAAAAAAAAQSTANAAQTAAGTAGTNATAALTMAGSKSKVYYSTDVATGTGTAAGDLWRQRNAGNEVIAEWQWSGSEWIKQTVSGSNVSNMDIGFLTAGAATMSQALIDKLVAGTASFQTVDVKNLFVTTGTMTEAVITKLWTDVVMSRKITAQMIAIGDFESLAPSLALEPELWTINMASSIINEPVALDGKALRIDQALGGASYGPFKVTVPGEQWRMSAAYKRVNGATAAINLRCYFYRSNNTYISSAFVASVGAGEGVATGTAAAPAGAAFARFGIVPVTGAAGASTLLYDMYGRRMTGAVLIENGAVTAEKFESQLVLATDIIAGNPLGTHAKMNANGIRVMASTDGGTPTEVVRLGTDTDDYIGVVDPATGNLSAAINSSGDISGQSLAIANQITLGGEDLGEKIRYMPQRLVAWGQVSINTDTMKLNPTGTEIGLFEIGWDSNQPDGADARMYEFKVHPFLVRSTVAGIVGLRVRYTTNGAAPTVSSALIGYNYTYCPANKYVALDFSRPIGSNNGDYIRVLVSMYSDAASTVDLLSGAGQTHLFSTVQDLGGTTVGSAVASGGGGSQGGSGNTPPPTPPVNPTVTTTKEWAATGIRSFIGSGATYNYNTGYMYSGPSPAGYGDLSSMAVFPSFTSLLSGATINDIWVYVYYDFWYQGSGGKGQISLHGQSALTSSKPSMSLSLTSPSWPRASGRWLRLPDGAYPGFKSGGWKGFGLGGVGGGYENYGYAHNPRIRIRYTK